ncbi:MULTISPECIES: DUF7848 domain-containing protein [Streptomyces]|uniref:DUF7848 domain-containing protein n=1 Tax=Streptomyces albus TaxID=1888 RepID=A0A6C1C332_9ACTN|nr:MULTISPECIES: hypothetical protein [Streptomyces]QID35902.1 hypothetical protein G3260_001948 [Streptomyces albus]TGG89598.1 hypothetical protein D8771_01480 [Streptomyces albus]UVN57304.1 hypothetical protein NR995_24420 [Streptomyces albus]
MTRATYRFREFRLVPDAEPDAEPVSFTMQCAVCGRTAAPHTSRSVPRSWATRHLRRNPEHFTFREIVTRPYRFVPGAWL